MKPNRSRSGFGSRPERVVAPTRVNGARSSGMEVAPAPLPTMMSMRKSSIARYSISSALRAIRWISSMNSTSPGASDDSTAARSPACWIAGPLDIRSGRPLSWATIMASVVLPRPGGPASRMWSGVRFCMAAASSSSCSCPRTFAWPTNSARDRGRRAPSKASSASDSRRSHDRVGHDRSQHRIARAAPAAGRGSRGRGAAAPAPPRVRVGGHGHGVLDGLRRDPLRPAEADQGDQHIVAHARGAHRGGTRRRGGEDLAGQRQHDELRGLRPDTGHPAERRVVLRRDRDGDLVGGHRREHAHGRFRADTGDATQQVEHRELVGIGEAEQREVVLAHDEGGVQSASAPTRSDSACCGVTCTARPTPPTSITTLVPTAARTVPRTEEITASPRSKSCSNPNAARTSRRRATPVAPR